jgi:lipopolysaccharide biosynthesis glycosyltransferase
MKHDKICMVTVTTENYVQWTMTMIYSFVKSNEWFQGDIILVCNDLSDEQKASFGIFPTIKLITPSEMLLEKVADLCRHIPGFTKLSALFYSLEIFNLEGYSKVLFLDSDMLVVKPVKEVFEFEAPFLASAETCWYLGNGRRTDTYESVQSFPDPGQFINNPVNSGFMVIDKHFINVTNYKGMVDMIDPGLWAEKNTFHADQLVINLFFKDRINLVDARYNFRPTNAREIFIKDHVTLEDASIIHYYRQYKPWNFNEVFELSQRNMLHIKAFRLWYEWYVDMLKYAHLKNAINLLQKNDKTSS